MARHRRVVYTLVLLLYYKDFNFVPGIFGFMRLHIFVLLAAVAHYVAVMGVAL